MKLNPPASSSDLETAREIAWRLHVRRPRGSHASPVAAASRREPRLAVASLAPAAPDPPPIDLEAIPEAPPPPSWDAPVGEAAPPEDAFDNLADLGEPPVIAEEPPTDEPPLPDVEVEGGGISPEEMIGSAEASPALGDLAEAEAPAVPPSPFEIDLDGTGTEEDVVGASALPSWDDIVERCLGISQARAAMLIDPAGQVFAAHGDWPAPGPDTIAGKLVSTMNRTLKDAPTRSISAPLARPAPHRVAGPARRGLDHGRPSSATRPCAPRPAPRSTPRSTAAPGSEPPRPAANPMARLDPHSHADSGPAARPPLEAAARRRLRAPGGSRARPTWCSMRRPGARSTSTARPSTVLDVRTGAGAAVPFDVGPDEPILGRRVRLTLPEGTREVRLRYRTSPEAPALQWLAPEQTAGGRHPFLFSQCQPIHARSLAPLADTARIRLTYEAEVEVEAPLAAVMSAGPTGEGPGGRPGTRAFRFAMPQPIPPYLLALAVGRLESRDLGPRSRVWAEPETVEAAAWEFAEMEAMIARAEELFGPYDWDRYDMLVLPPSFPYGGMENPRMTFLTPTLLAGDRSLVDVVAHELAHSWTGNLVTNADMEHFWLNEGFTVWAERRILEALHGEEAAVLALGHRREGARRVDRALRRRLALHAPAHRPRGDRPRRRVLLDPLREGGALRGPPRAARGARRASTRFMREYMARFRFTSITTEEFLAFLEEKLPGPSPRRVDARAWLYAAGAARERPRLPLGPRSRLSRGPRRRASRAASGRRRPRSRAWRPAETARLPPAPPARARRRRVRLARRDAGPHRPGQLRDPRRVADHRRRLRLRAGLPPAPRGAAHGRAG